MFTWTVVGLLITQQSTLGRRLMLLRKRAIDSGMRLLSEDEVLKEVKQRRGELEQDEAHI